RQSPRQSQDETVSADAGTQGLILMVLDNNICDDDAEPSRKKFSELEFKTLNTPDLYSFKSLTSENLRSIFNAIKDNWITREQAQVFEQYHMDSPSRDDDEYNWSNKPSQLAAENSGDVTDEEDLRKTVFHIKVNVSQLQDTLRLLCWDRLCRSLYFSQLPQSIVDCLKLRIQNTKIRGKKCELNEESDNLKGLFEKELACT
ncbi:hypothetical protein PROFUN_16386, partial [Planoprotostelium fungivorum]